MKSRVSNICWWKATYQNSGGNFQELDRIAALVPGKPELALCHTFPLRVWRPYCQVIPRVRRCTNSRKLSWIHFFSWWSGKPFLLAKSGDWFSGSFIALVWLDDDQLRKGQKFRFSKKKKKKNIYIYIYLKFNLLDINFFSRGVYFLYTEIARKKTD